MDQERSIARIKRISDAPGAPGFEGEVAKVIQDEGQGLGRFSQDKMGNLYLERAGNALSMDATEASLPFVVGRRPLRVQLDAHMDEVAFMVQAIRPNGCLEMLPLGGWATSNIPAHQMLVRTPEGRYLKGLTTSTPPHYLSEEEREKALRLEEIVLDLGCTSKEELLALGVEIGEPILPDVRCSYDDKRDLFAGKAFDCRSGCAAILDVMETLKDERLSLDLIAGFACQEEVGVRGAELTSRRIRPDLGIVFEGCPADDSFGKSYQQQTKLREGPMLRHLDARMITHPGFQRHAIQVAQSRGMKLQRAVRKGGATNASAIHQSLHAPPCIVIGIPVRYIHTAYGYCTHEDHRAAVDLAVAILQGMSPALFESI